MRRFQVRFWQEGMPVPDDPYAYDKDAIEEILKEGAMKKPSKEKLARRELFRKEHDELLRRHGAVDFEHNVLNDKTGLYHNTPVGRGELIVPTICGSLWVRCDTDYSGCVHIFRRFINPELVTVHLGMNFTKYTGKWNRLYEDVELSPQEGGLVTTSFAWKDIARVMDLVLIKKGESCGYS